MSKSNAAPVRDWLIKKYEKALRTIWEQTTEIQELKNQIRAAERGLQDQHDNFRQQATDMLAGINVQLADNGLMIPMDTVSTSTEFAGGDLTVQVVVELPRAGVVDPTHQDGVLDAVNAALASEDFKRYSAAPGSHPISQYDGPAPSRFSSAQNPRSSFTFPDDDDSPIAHRGSDFSPTHWSYDEPVSEDLGVVG